MTDPTCPIAGLIGDISVGGTFVGMLTGVTLNATRDVTEFAAMGTFETTCLLPGRVRYAGNFDKGYMCATYFDIFRDSPTTGGATFAGTFYPRGTAACGTIAGSLMFTSWALEGWEAESSAAKIESMDFILIAVSSP